MSIFALRAAGPGARRFQEMWEKEGYSGGTVGTVQTFYFLGEEDVDGGAAGGAARGGRR